MYDVPTVGHEQLSKRCYNAKSIFISLSVYRAKATFNLPGSADVRKTYLTSPFLLRPDSMRNLDPLIFERGRRRDVIEVGLLPRHTYRRLLSNRRISLNLG